MIDKLFIEISNVFDDATVFRTVAYELNRAAAERDYQLLDKKFKEMKTIRKKFKDSTDLLFRKYEEAKEADLLEGESDV